MQFLVDFDVVVPEGVPDSVVRQREVAEADTAARLAADGQLLRVWKRPAGHGTSTVLGLYDANNASELDDILRNLPLYDWMRIVITPLDPHPNDPQSTRRRRNPETRAQRVIAELPDPQLGLAFCLEASLGLPLDIGQLPRGQRRIVPLTGGRFIGPQIQGVLLPGASADWQTVLSDGTALGDIRYTLQTDEGEVIYVQSRSVRHGSPEVLARLARGDPVDPSEYTFRASTQIEAASLRLDWLNKGVFTTVGGRTGGGVTYATYLVA